MYCLYKQSVFSSIEKGYRSLNQSTPRMHLESRLFHLGLEISEDLLYRQTIGRYRKFVFGIHTA